MRTFFIMTTILFFTLSPISCSKSGEDAQERATSFLKAFLSVEYEKAAEFCTEELSSFLNETGKEFSNLNDSIKAEIRRQTEKITSTIENVEEKSKDTVIINYYLNDNNNLIKNTLSMVNVNGEWRVAALNRL